MVILLAHTKDCLGKFWGIYQLSSIEYISVTQSIALEKSHSSVTPLLLILYPSSPGA